MHSAGAKARHDIVNISLPIIGTGGAKNFRNPLEGEYMSALPCLSLVSVKEHKHSSA